MQMAAKTAQFEILANPWAMGAGWKCRETSACPLKLLDSQVDGRSLGSSSAISAQSLMHILLYSGMPQPGISSKGIIRDVSRHFTMRTRTLRIILMEKMRKFCWIENEIEICKCWAIEGVRTCVYSTCTSVNLSVLNGTVFCYNLYVSARIK